MEGIFIQCYKMGNKSLPLVLITAFIMGLVLTLQTRPSLVNFGAEALLPGMVSVSVIKEIGPVITAIICAGKIGSRIGAELGSMKVTEQIDAMEVSAINPFPLPGGNPGAGSYLLYCPFWLFLQIRFPFFHHIWRIIFMGTCRSTVISQRHFQN